MQTTRQEINKSNLSVQFLTGHYWLYLDKEQVDHDLLYHGILNALRNDVDRKVKVITILTRNGNFKTIRREI